MVSFAQNAEDVVLARAFHGRATGRYVDVGAAHPVDHSVTKHFYDLGWRGVNVEPHPGFLALLEEHRPHDVNLGVAVADHVGEATFFLGPHEHPGGSTLSAEVADLVWEGRAASTTTVEVTTLAEILAEHVGEATIDFLKVDVEGREREVLAGSDWDRWRPLVVVVEATKPNSPVPDHEAWEPILIDAGYGLTLFDGLNRFYAPVEHPELHERLAVPANVFDDWVPSRVRLLEERLAAAEAEIAPLGDLAHHPEPPESRAQVAEPPRDQADLEVCGATPRATAAGDGFGRSREARSLEAPGGPTEAPRAAALPTVVHVASLVGAFAWLMWLGRDQWFFGDEWDFLARRGLRGAELSLWAPHNEHWSTAPILAYRALFGLFGVRTYAPYLALVVLLHVATAHLLWVLLRRVGVAPWIAVAAASTFLFGGGGAENVLWAFQIGFVGALLLGFVLMLLAVDDERTPRKEAVAAAVAVFALTWSGVAVPFVAGAGALALMRWGWQAALRVVAPAAAAYALWLLLAGRGGLQSHQVTTRGLLLVPAYVWRGMVTTVESATFLSGAGPVVLLALAWLLLRRPEWRRTKAAAGLAGALAALLLYLAVAPGRISLGLEQAQSSRYHHMAWALLVPALAIALQELAGRSAVRQAAVALLAAACALHGVNAFLGFAEHSAAQETQLRRTVAAAYDLARSGAPVFPLPPHPVLAPDLAPPSRMVEVLGDGRFRSPPGLTAADRLRAAAALQVRLPPAAMLTEDGRPGIAVVGVDEADTVPAGTGCLGVRPRDGHPRVHLDVAHPSPLRLISTAGGELRVLVRDPASGEVVDPGLILELAPGAEVSVDLALRPAAPLLLLPPAGETILCGLASG